MIHHVAIKGFKCLRDVEATLAPFTVLIGPNDSGKSTFLQAMGAPWSGSRGGVVPPYEVSVSGETALASARGTERRVERTFQSGGSEVNADDVMRAVAVDGRPAPAIPADLAGLITTQPLVLDARRICLSSAMNGARLDSIITHQGLGIAAHIARLALSDREHFDSIQRAMVEVTAGRVKTCLVDDNGNGQYSLSFRLYDDTVIAAADLSAGLLMYLGFLAILHRGDAPGVLLIEEPENGLHPLRLREVVGLLRKLNERGTQVICTTHSPDLLSACEPHEVRVFRRVDRDSGTVVRELPAHFDRIAMRQSIGEVWASRGEEGLLDELPGVKPTVRAEAS